MRRFWSFMKTWRFSPQKSLRYKICAVYIKQNDMLVKKKIHRNLKIKKIKSLSGSKVWGERTSTWMNAYLSFTLWERFIRKHYITVLSVYATCSKKLIKIFTGGCVKIKMTQVLVVMHQSFWGSLPKIEHFLSVYACMCCIWNTLERGVLLI